MQPSEKIVKPAKPTNYLILEFPTHLTLEQRSKKTGYFIGRDGKNLKRLERSYNIRINIPNDKSRENICKWVKQTQAKTDNNSIDGLWIMITKKNNRQSPQIENIKKELQDKWKEFKCPYVALEFPSELTLDQRHEQIRRFVGPVHCDLKRVENKFPVHITVFDETSKRPFREMAIRIQAEKKQNPANYLLLAVTAATSDCTDDIIELAKQRLQNDWNVSNINAAIQRRESAELLQEADFSGDDRWINRKPKDKRNRMQKQAIKET